MSKGFKEYQAAGTLGQDFDGGGQRPLEYCRIDELFSQRPYGKCFSFQATELSAQLLNPYDVKQPETVCMKGQSSETTFSPTSTSWSMASCSLAHWIMLGLWTPALKGSLSLKGNFVLISLMTKDTELGCVSTRKAECKAS